MADDKLLFVLLGLAIGIPIGLLIHKFLLPSLGQQQVLYGASYSYDKETGRLTQYMPLPLPLVTSPMVTQPTPTVQKATEIPPPMAI